MTKKTYLRYCRTEYGTERLDLFEGTKEDIKMDIKYWEEYNKTIPRYFKLEEVR